jgi:NitT/TauT family transport system substrate-binding protein
MNCKKILVALLFLWGSQGLRAEVSTVVSGYQYGLTYLPLMVMKEQGLVEKQALSKFQIKLSTEWRVLSGPAPINDGLLAGSLHFGAVGTSSLVTLWAKTHDKLGIKAVGSLSSVPMFLNTNNPNIKTLEDFTAKDKIALPSIKVSVQAVTLQMAAAQKWGVGAYSRLDQYTVGMAHPEAYVALLSQKPAISAHFASVPFQSQELSEGKGRVHRVLSSYEILGGPASFTLVVASTPFRTNNPKVYESYVAAFEEATAFIQKNKKAAAELYLKVTGSKENPASIEALLNDSDHIFDLTPRQIKKYADFMYEVGTVKVKATSWQDLVHPNLLTLQGS